MMIEKVMIQSGAKSLKNSRGVVPPPPMMIEQLGAKNLKSSGGMMIEKVMIQIGAKSEKIAGGLGGGGGSPPHDDGKSDDSIGAKKILQKAVGGSSVPLRQGLVVQVRIQSRAN